jgi:hypothetical protein
MMNTIENKTKNKTERTKTDSDGCALQKELLKIARMQNPNKRFWAKLDNAGLIFPSNDSIKSNALYRLTVLLKQKVEPLVLQAAVNDIVGRFPSIVASIRRGLFWFYIETPSKPIVVQKVVGFCSRRLAVDGKHSMIRVTYFEHELNVEFFHSSTDGTGAFLLFNTLLARYFERSGIKIDDRTGCADYLDLPRPEELEDFYQNLASNSKAKLTKQESYAYQNKGSRLFPGALILTKGFCSASELNAIAKSKNATIGQLVTACMLMSYNNVRNSQAKQSKLKTKVTVAVNLRNMFPTKTLRNFSSYITYSVEQNQKLDEIIESVKQRTLEKYKPEYFQAMVNFNVAGQNNRLVKILPLPIKNIALRVAYKKYGEKMRTSSVTNLGNVAAPKEFAEHVLRYECSFGVTVINNPVLAFVSYNDILNFSFTRTIRQSAVEREFFKILASLGLNIAVESNVGA